jgi:hypothetical protein
VLRRGRDARSVSWIKLAGADTMTVAAKVAEIAQQSRPDAIFIDGGGPGGGVVDRLRQLQHRVFDVQFGGMRQAVGGEIEDVPAFNSISYEGVVHRCVAFCNDRGKEYGLPLNAWATALWHSALRRQGFERGLRREDGTVADRLIGNVVVVFEDKTVPDRYNLAQSPAIVPTLESPSRETYREIDLIAEAERLFNT